MRKGNADVLARSLDILGLTYTTSIWNNSNDQVIGGLFGFLSSSEANRSYSGHGLFGLVFAAPPLSIGQLVENSPFLAARNAGSFETIPSPGVAVAGPTITLGNDSVELTEQATDRSIEET